MESMEGKVILFGNTINPISTVVFHRYERSRTRLVARRVDFIFTVRLSVESTISVLGNTSEPIRVRLR